jgi:cysteinyl-tRNA synthetase
VRLKKKCSAIYALLFYVTPLDQYFGLVQYNVDDFLKSDIGQEALGLSEAEIEDFIQQRVDAKKIKTLPVQMKSVSLYLLKV